MVGVVFLDTLSERFRGLCVVMSSTCLDATMDIFTEGAIRRAKGLASCTVINVDYEVLEAINARYTKASEHGLHLLRAFKVYSGRVFIVGIHKLDNMGLGHDIMDTVGGGSRRQEERYGI